MRWNYAHDIKSEPGTCGGCIHFRRAKNGAYTSAQGNCVVSPKRWIYSQCTKACKRHYQSIKEEVHKPKPSYISLAYTETRLKPAVKKAFAELWNSTIKSADRALYGWEANPWVWVIEFERISKVEAQHV